ncbi:Pre-mRNA-splicing factor cef1 [Coccidioides posadasii str. Silveira]|uniref:Pre-mRNA splicing factor cef-1 n=2 Tax=Coccidioides posadasii TaxID=199306 RepID=E9DD02_COCPS|nr:myb family transcription factor [Coccidioides posadasii C735 delta SOWgp]EER24168.1 myb family transcription factor [Coccidioides posadasii C735 delta SOWgp]EFW15527.1 pre-mRNA splicing factor cef-1 [Coccidioides posadasii str. Silveira]QVM07668.1 Pre-mRNA-splicing factor cef1 [Coccidioides posadasii str. Silveira]|eukprot:XP_003066313.1 myb family transcription factor [Coccidioides posadasii C735 delta SOWgp]
MPVVKGGVWTNIEDEIVKVAVSKYGLNQWARVSSLLARKTPKQCKARWSEWLDPAIRKVEWSKEEDEKLLHLAKLMPTQWRTIAPIVGRTATQCLERYQKLLDEAEARESDELGLGGPAGGETAAPSADDVRRLRPGELDPDPESKPARPDTIDLDEDEKEMLSEARARLANTQGKKAKRKARERQLEESRRLAVLQKRRELKNAGINIKVVTTKKGQMDYNADIPFEKKPAPGFYNTTEEQARNERQREMFDPRKQQLANKRKGDQDEEQDKKRQKNDKTGSSAAFAAAAKAGQMQRIREAEQSSKRRALVLPSPQVSEGELEEIVKMGMAGERASRMAGDDDNEGTRGLIANYSSIIGGTPIRTPRAPPEEDRIANEIRNIKALTETQSSLLGGENAPLLEGGGSTGFEGIAPRKHQMVTPNPMATPFRQGGAGTIGGTPLQARPGATPLRTPRDNFMINKDTGLPVASTPKEMKIQENFIRRQLRQQLGSLPKPKETEWELEELPSEQPEPIMTDTLTEEDAAERDKRNKAAAEEAAKEKFKRQTQVYQRGLPRPRTLDIAALMKQVEEVEDPVKQMVAREMAIIIAHDAHKFPLQGMHIEGKAPKRQLFSNDLLAKAREDIAAEVSSEVLQQWQNNFDSSWASLHECPSALPGLSIYTDEDDFAKQEKDMTAAFDRVQNALIETAEQGNKLEKKVALHYGGYQARAKTLRNKILEANEALQKAKFDLDSFRTLQIAEESAVRGRVESLREEVTFVSRREREAQEVYRQRKEELDSLEAGSINGWH